MNWRKSGGWWEPIQRPCDGKCRFQIILPVGADVWIQVLCLDPQCCKETQRASVSHVTKDILQIRPLECGEPLIWDDHAYEI